MIDISEMMNEMLEGVMNKAKEEIVLSLAPEGEGKEFLKLLIKNGCPVDALLNAAAELAEKKNDEK